MLIVDALHVLVEEEAGHDFFGVLDLHLSRAVNNLTIEHSVADSQAVLLVSSRKQSQRTDTGLGVPRQRLAGNIREADFAGDSTAADNCLVVAKLILFNNDGTHVKDCQPGHFRTSCYIHVRGNQSRRVDMFNIAERISGVINVVVGVLVICHELSQDRVISRTDNKLRSLAHGNGAERCGSIRLARSFSQTEVLGNLSLRSRFRSARTRHGNLSRCSGSQAFDSQNTSSTDRDFTGTFQALDRQITAIENLCNLVGLNLERLDGKDAVIDIETTVGHRNSRIEVTVALCSTCGCVAQDQFG